MLSLLLDNHVVIGTQEEGDEGEKWDPGVLWEESLGDSQGDWRDAPVSSKDWPDAGLVRRDKLGGGSGSCDKGHEDDEARGLDRGDNGVGGDDLADFPEDTGLALESPLKSHDEVMGEGCGDEEPVKGHLDDSGGEIRASVWILFTGQNRGH